MDLANLTLPQINAYLNRVTNDLVNLLRLQQLLLNFNAPQNLLNNVQLFINQTNAEILHINMEIFRRTAVRNWRPTVPKRRRK